MSKPKWWPENLYAKIGIKGTLSYDVCQETSDQIHKAYREHESKAYRKGYKDACEMHAYNGYDKNCEEELEEALLNNQEE